MDLEVVLRIFYGTIGFGSLLGLLALFACESLRCLEKYLLNAHLFLVERHFLLLDGSLVRPSSGAYILDNTQHLPTGFVVESISIQNDDAALLAGGRKWAMWFLVLAMVNIVSSFAAGFFLSTGGGRIDRRLRLVALRSLLRQVSLLC